MKVSIVTISFNQEKFLEEAIKSVINQSYKNIEYIVVDPGSTDASRDIIEKYRSQIDVIIYDPDTGPADGLNKGFSVATGKIFGFLNSDDIYLTDTVLEVVDFFKKNHDVDVVSGHCFIINKLGKIVRRAYSDRYSLQKYAYGLCSQVQPSTFFKSSAYNSVSGFNANNKISWDGELFVDMGLAGNKFATKNKIWSGYRVYPGSITASNEVAKERMIEAIRNFNKIKGRPERLVDKFVRKVLWVHKHISNPVALYERLRRGPIVDPENIK